MAQRKKFSEAQVEPVTGEFGKGFSSTKLAYGRTFFLLYQDRLPIFQSLTGKSADAAILQSVTAKSADTPIFQSAIGKLKNANFHARAYRLYLPSKEELQRKLVEWAKDSGASHA